MKFVFNDFTLSAVAVVLVFAAIFTGIAVLWLAAVPFVLGVAVVFKNKGHRFFALFWLLLAALYLANFLVRL